MLLLVSTSSPHLREAAPGREKLILEHEETREMELVQSAKCACQGCGLAVVCWESIFCGLPRTETPDLIR